MDQNGTRLENFSIVYVFELFGGCKIQNGTRVEFVQIVLVFELFGAKRYKTYTVRNLGLLAVVGRCSVIQEQQRVLSPSMLALKFVILPAEL